MRFTYIIWSPQGEKPPTATFTRRWAAENEAQRLSLAHPNQVFHVCKIKSATVAGQSAYFGKWRPAKSYRGPYTGISKRVVEAVSEADLIDEASTIPYRLGMNAMVNA